VCGKFWPFGEGKKNGGAVTLTKKFFFAIFREKKRRKNPYLDHSF
jgi:hypothetical protein